VDESGWCLVIVNLARASGGDLHDSGNRGGKFEVEPRWRALAPEGMQGYCQLPNRCRCSTTSSRIYHSLALQGFQHLSKQLAQEIVVWCLLEAELAHIVHVDRELLRNPYITP